MTDTQVVPGPRSAAKTETWEYWQARANKWHARTTRASAICAAGQISFFAAFIAYFALGGGIAGLVVAGLGLAATIAGIGRLVFVLTAYAICDFRSDHYYYIAHPTEAYWRPGNRAGYCGAPGPY